MKFYALTVVLFSMCASCLVADIISIDFNNTTISAWVIDGSETAGPVNVGNWNTTSTASGTLNNLVDETGTATTASITWSSPNTWTTGELNGDPDLALSHAYLDDGPSGGNNGPSITISNIPFANYRVYGLFASGQNIGGVVQMVDFTVNGTALFGTSVDAYGTVADNRTNNAGAAWTEIDTDNSIVGNYWTFDTSGSTLTVTNGGRNGSARGSITGLQIEALPVPEPSTFLLTLVMGLSLLVARKSRR